MKSLYAPGEQLEPGIYYYLCIIDYHIPEFIKCHGTKHENSWNKMAAMEYSRWAELARWLTRRLSQGDMIHDR